MSRRFFLEIDLRTLFGRDPGVVLDLRNALVAGWIVEWIMIASAARDGTRPSFLKIPICVSNGPLVTQPNQPEVGEWISFVHSDYYDEQTALLSGPTDIPWISVVSDLLPQKLCTDLRSLEILVTYSNFRCDWLGYERIVKRMLIWSLCIASTKQSKPAKFRLNPDFSITAHQFLP